MGKRAKCKICKKTFAEQRSVLRHMESAHDMLKFECKTCNKVFARMDILHQHYKTKSHKNNDRNNKMLAEQLTNESSNKIGTISNHNKIPRYNTDESINGSTSNIEVGDIDQDLDEEIDSSLPIIYSYDDEDSILSMNWEDSFEQLRTAAGPVEERSDASYKTLGRREEQNPKQTFNLIGHSLLPAQFESSVFTYSELLKIAKGEENGLNAAGSSKEVHQIRFPSDIKVYNDECITIPSDDEEPPDKQLTASVSQAHTTPNTTKRLCGESFISPESQLTEPTTNSAKRLRRENDVLVDSNVFDLLKKKTLDAHDEDQMFLLSILSDFRKVLPQNKLKVKIKIAQAIADGS